MENLEQKAHFLRQDLVNVIKSIPINAKPLWGKMNVQQMVEHMSYSLRQANGKDLYECVTPEDAVPRMQAFLMSEKQFRENTPNQLLPDTPASPVHNTMQASLNELEGEIARFFAVFEDAPDRKITNPFFGDLDYSMWVQLLYKHAWHHLRQYGISEQ